MTYFLNSSLMSLRVNDLITDEKKKEKEVKKKRKMNNLIFVKI